MVNDVLEGVSSTLGKAYGSEKPIYINDVEQGFLTPCFFIEVIYVRVQKLLAGRSQLSLSLDVYYFPKDPRNNTAMWCKGTEILGLLEHLVLLNGDMLHGWERECKIVDGVLHCTVTYHIFCKTEEMTQELMETLEANYNLWRE